MFQWIAAAFASATFDCTRHDRIIIPVAVDTRRKRDQDTVGMFAVVLPLALDRPTQRGELIESCRRELFQMVARRHVRADALQEMYAAAARRWGRTRRTTVSLTYTVSDGFSDEADVGPLVLEHGAYHPRFNYTVDGVALTVIDTPDAVTLRFAFGEASFSAEAMDRFTATCLERLTDIDTFLAATREIAASSFERSPLRDPDGRTLVVVDTGLVEETLRTHPAVGDAAVAVETADDGGDVLAASVSATAPITADELIRFVSGQCPAHPFLATPGRIAVIAAPHRR